MKISSIDDLHRSRSFASRGPRWPVNILQPEFLVITKAIGWMDADGNLKNLVAAADIAPQGLQSGRASLCLDVFGNFGGDDNGANLLLNLDDLLLVVFFDHHVDRIGAAADFGNDIAVERIDENPGPADSI